jgi:hypothetical protein
MRRRKFIALLGSWAVAWPLVARAQQGERVRRVGFLSAIAESDLEVQSWIREFLHRLQELGWTNGGNVQVDFRFSDADCRRAVAASAPAASTTSGRNSISSAATIDMRVATHLKGLVLEHDFARVPAREAHADLPKVNLRLKSRRLIFGMEEPKN